ncbi:MAG: AMP-binding protein, partial [Bacteroidales bacterium]|nr:AMP-binding protein [Bacteroidales bacterium]
MVNHPSYRQSIVWKGKTYSPMQFRDYLSEKLLEIDMEEWERDIFSFGWEWMNDQKQEFEIQTSGSTSKPKIILHSREAMINRALATGKALQLQVGDSALLCLPAKYIAGKMMIVRALVLGLNLYYEQSNIPIIETVNRTYDFCALIPLQIQYAIDHHLEKKLNQLHTIIVGGAKLAEEYIEPLNKLKNKVFATYGMTETITH